MYSKRVLFNYCGFASSFSLESSRIGLTCASFDGFPVHRGPFGRCLLRIAFMECCPVRGSGSGLHRKEEHYLSPRHVSALYPILPFSTLTYPALPCCPPLSVCLCFSPVCV